MKRKAVEKGYSIPKPEKKKSSKKGTQEKEDHVNPRILPPVTLSKLQDEPEADELLHTLAPPTILVEDNDQPKSPLKWRPNKELMVPKEEAMALRREGFGESSKAFPKWLKFLEHDSAGFQADPYQVSCPKVPQCQKPEDSTTQRGRCWQKFLRM